MEPSIRVRQPELDFRAWEWHVAITHYLRVRPLTVLVAVMPRDADVVAKDDDVCLQAFEATVGDELLAQIDGFGARREHLDHDTRRRRVHLVGISWVAHYLDIRVVHELSANAQPHVAAID